MDKIELFVSLCSLFGFPALYFLCHFSYKVAIDKYPYDEQSKKQKKWVNIYYRMQKTTVHQRESREKWEKSMKMFSVFSWKLFKIFTPIACVLFVIYAAWLHKYPTISLIGMVIYLLINYIVTMIHCYRAQYKI
jgi:hypothetical protein